MSLVLALELWCESSSGDHVVFSALASYFRTLETKAPYHVCFCCHFPLLSSWGLCLGTREASWNMLTSSGVIWRKSTCERKGLCIKHHLPSPLHSPLCNFLLSRPLCGLCWAVQPTGCHRRAPPSKLPFGPEADLAIACLWRAWAQCLLESHKNQLFPCNSRSSSGAAFLVFGEGMRRAPSFPYTFLLPANTVDWYPASSLPVLLETDLSSC